MSRKPFTAHPQHDLASNIASDKIIEAVRRMDIPDRVLDLMQERADALSNNLTKFLLAAYDKSRM